MVGRTLTVAAAGVVLGLAGAWLLSRLLTSLLFEVSPSQPGIYLAASVCLLLIAGVAGFLPARRAVRVDPMSIIRYE